MQSSTTLFLAATSLLVGLAHCWECSGASYEDVPYNDDGDCSAGTQVHISRAYDAVTQTTSTVYYSGVGTQTLYVSEQLSETFDLYDFEAGVVYKYADGSCSTYRISSGQYSWMELLSNSTIDWDVEDFNGIPSRAYTITDNHIITKGIMRWDCMEGAMYIDNYGEVVLAAFHANFLNVDVQTCIDNAFANAQEMLDYCLALG